MDRLITVHGVNLPSHDDADVCIVVRVMWEYWT